MADSRRDTSTLARVAFGWSALVPLLVALIMNAAGTVPTAELHANVVLWKWWTFPQSLLSLWLVGVSALSVAALMVCERRHVGARVALTVSLSTCLLTGVTMWLFFVRAMVLGGGFH